jgi:hypothetical protein
VRFLLADAFQDPSRLNFLSITALVGQRGSARKRTGVRN